MDVQKHLLQVKLVVLVAELWLLFGMILCVTIFDTSCASHPLMERKNKPNKIITPVREAGIWVIHSFESFWIAWHFDDVAHAETATADTWCVAPELDFKKLWPVSYRAVLLKWELRFCSSQTARRIFKCFSHQLDFFIWLWVCYYHFTKFHNL